MKLKFKLLGLATAIVVSAISLGTAEAQINEICNTLQPNGVTHTQCPYGVGFPSFNQYRDQKYLGSTSFNEANFARVRRFTEAANSQPLLGYRDSIEYTQNDIDQQNLFEGFYYMHNSGRSDCNTTDLVKLNENDCIGSTFAKDVKIKLSLADGYEYRVIDGLDNVPRVVSNGRLDRTTGKRVHTIIAEITSSNTNPRTITDSYTVITPGDKSLFFSKTSKFQSCKSFTTNDECADEEMAESPELTIDLFRGSGVDVSSSYVGNPTSNFLASSQYVKILKTYKLTTDAPDEQLVCEGITATRVSGTPQSTTQTYRVRFTPNETEFHNAITISGAQSTTNFEDPTFGRKYTDVTFTNLTPNATATIASAGNGANCSTQITFPDIPGPEVCRELNLIEVSKTEDSVTFDITTTPSRFASTANVTSQNGSIESLGNNRYRLTGISEATTVSAKVPESEQGYENCQAERSFTPEPPNLVCEDININTTTYNYQENARPTFRVTQKTPAEFQAEFRWQVLGEDNEVIQTRSGQDLLSFRPNSPLTGNEKITVNVINSNNPNCSGEITSELPPKEDVCEDLDIIRILNPQLRRTIPNNGQPAIFQLDGGDYEGKITFQAEGEPNKTIFITNDQRTSDSITVDIDETVIILNTGEANTIRVFAQEQNQYTVNCNLVLRADSDDEGDKLTELDKSVDKAFATDGDILTYTIKYTISPIFGNSEFREALEGLDTATLKDNIRNIYGIQDKLTNPLESRDSKLEILNISIDERLRDATGDLFGPEGFVIENLTQRAGNTYTIRYTARLEADIIEECQVITDSCGFEFPNTVSDNLGNSDTASVLATCPFVVSRSFGDVFLEEEFEGTIDIARCTNKRNTEGPVFTPRERTPQELISSGSGAFSAPTHRICRESISANPNLDSRELEGYNNPLENFSSSVCEVSLFTSANWTSEDIERNLRSNASRFQNVTNLNGVNTLESLNASNLITYDSLNPNSDTKVYRKTNGDLIISADSDIILNDGIAKTIIVEGHDLIIDQNIKYQTTNSPFPSQIAFIVIGGDVIVGKDVTHMVGAIAAVPDSNGNGGFIKRSEETDKLLTIRGSIFGDSGPLFAGTSNPGNLLADQGAVTVIYDSGIILNTPPGLQSIIQFNQYQTVR